MKTIKFLRRHFFVAIALLTAGVTLSFKMAEKEEVKAPTIYHYVSDDMEEGDFKKVANWSTVDDEVQCGADRIRPCAITVQENSTLATVLGNKTNSEVLDISEGYQPAP